ncbi:hypothetical protein [Treponema sp.]|uniref:hypothetical protein n=1 Tax=Treponema sp. TaxID=166 RepID=UPI003F07FA80
MKMILKDGVIYSVGNWDSGKNQWVCQNIRTGENRLFEPGEIMRAIDITPTVAADLKYQI